MVLIYPKKNKIKGKYNQGQSAPGDPKNPCGACGNVGYYSWFQSFDNPNNLCDASSSVASWGDIEPDPLPYSEALWWGRDCITTWSGSYNRPSPFEVTEWNIPNNIPDTAIVKEITIEYAIKPTYYRQHGYPCFIYNETSSAERSYNGNWYYGVPGNTVGNKIKSNAGNPFTITLNCNGTNKTANGTGLQQKFMGYAGNKTYNISPQQSYRIYKGSNTKFTIKKLRTAKLTFSPPRNLAGDVGRIVMQYIRLNVKYENIPPKFNIKKLSISPSSITNCPGEKSTIEINLNGKTTTKGKTQVKLSGSGVTNGTFSNAQKTGNDTFKKQKDGTYIWTVNTDCKKRTLKVDVSYSQPGTYTIKAKVTKNAYSKNAKEAKVTVKSCKPTFNFEFLDNNMKTNKVFKYSSIDAKEVYFRLTVNKSQILSQHNEKIEIDTDGLPFADSKWTVTTNTSTNDVVSTQKGNIVTFTNVAKYSKIVIVRRAILDESGIYNVTGKYINNTEPNWNNSKKYNLEVKGVALGKDYFKLRLEDGSDVKYNSLMVTKGDDLLEPLTYTTEDITKYINNMMIYGETKRIPLNETQYINFTIDLDTKEKIELKNVLAYIDIYDENYEADNIIVGVGDGVKLLESDEAYICSIDTISSEEPTIVKLAVRSSVEIDDVIIKLKPYNYDGYVNGTWIPSHVKFKDIPNIKISIEGISDLNFNVNEPNGEDIFWLYYKIQNLSDVDAENVRFQLKEPNQFVKLCYIFEQDNDCEDSYNNTTDTWFNKNNRIITFKKLEAHSAERIIAVKYRAIKKGIYNFIIHTLDDKNDLNDDQYENSYQHTLMVNIPNDVRITTDVSKSLPYVNELIDFHIKVINLHKKQKTFKFDIYDIGSYDTSHPTNDYLLEYVKCKNGTFTPMHDDNYQYPNSHNGNKVGEWVLKDIDVNDEYHLTLSVRPQDTGNHIFKTIFTDQLQQSRDFYDEVKVIENDKQLDFNVYHAVSDDDIPCDNCDDLEKICDDDFINLGDNIYYVIEIKNNSRNEIKNALHVYARLPESFLTNGVICSSYNYLINQTNNLVSFTIPSLPGCEHEDSTFKICMKIKPSEIGQYVSNFSLSTRNSKVLYKQLNLTVDTEFNERKLEHEIKIYNFDKTNKYYRYEIDNVGEIFKFFNTGDKTLRPIRSESFSKSAVETYKGTNLRDVINQIKEKSKYVDPLFLREGSNKLADKGYELFPDGLIRRFGLLNSEVYHYSGQFPITTDLVDKAMKWDIDKWDTKLWAGDIYDNGVFSLSIDYSKVPSNFDILNVDNPIQDLQDLVDNVKPYGTKAICHYSATIKANLQMNIDTIINQIKYDIDVHLLFPDDFTLISLYDTFDSSVNAYYDLAKILLKAEVNKIANKVYDKEADADTLKSTINEVSTHIFADKIIKQKTKDCYDLISNAYTTNTQARNIDITKPFNTNYNRNTNENLSDIKVINFDNELDDKEQIGFKIKPFRDTQIYTHEGNIDDTENITDNIIYCVYCRDDINDFTGFKFILNNNIIQERNLLNTTINNISIQVQVCTQDDKKILHFWGSINQEEYYHIGLLIINDFNQPIVQVYNEASRNVSNYSIDNENDDAITFKISDKVKTLHKSFDKIEAIEKDNRWQYLKRINQGNNKYSYFENKINIDPKCTSRPINVPKLVLKYNDIDIDNLDEIIDIKFNIEAQSNKKDFANDININLYKDADKYIPEDDIGREICYPSAVNNVNQNLIATMDMEQENITICNTCLKTSLGYHEKCPHCNSSYVRYSNEKMPATACYNCGWIINGWNDYCTHCLSFDVEKIQIDYNKTYCENCNSISNDYYENCPQCGSSKVIHLTNNTNRCKIFGEDKQNIDPITINIDAQQVNAFSLYIPFSKNSNELKLLEYLKLKVHGTNNNNGKYYYCESCGSAGLGHYNTCPHCNSKLIHNECISNNSLKVYYQSGDTYIAYEDLITKPIYINECSTDAKYNASINVDSFIQEIDLLKCACHNNRDRFKLIFVVENQAYNDILNTILKLPVKDEYQSEILDAILPFNITIDNLSLDYKYQNEYEWVGLKKLEGLDHTGVRYQVPINKKTTDALTFSDFNITPGKYQRAYLYVNGFLKNITNDVVMNVKINNNGHIYNISKLIQDTLFTYNYNIINDTGEYLENVSIEISFTDANSGGEIIITDCNITTEFTKYKNDIHDGINEISAEFVNEHNNYLFKSNSELWGLNNTQPYYLSGKQLSTNLLAYIDFGKLDLQEYIRIYNIDMIISYKAKNGNIITETIASRNQDESLKVILMGAGYSETQAQDIINSTTTLTTALANKDKHIDTEQIEQLLSGEITLQNGELWGVINYPKEALNNLELENTNINADDELVSAIPLYYKIAQSFNTGNDFTSISTVYIDYFGKRGYPNDSINVYLCKDNDNQPGNIIASSKATINNISEILNVDLDVYNLQPNTQYWIVLEDVSANKNNYHRFNYNNNFEIGQLITYEGKHYTYEASVLSFGIAEADRNNMFYSLPTTWIFDTENFDGYKIHNIFYRYNIQEGSNASLSNFLIKSGYSISDIEVPSSEETPTTPEEPSEDILDEEYIDETIIADAEDVEGTSLPEPDEEDDEEYEDEDDEDIEEDSDNEEYDDEEDDDENNTLDEDDEEDGEDD